MINADGVDAVRFGDLLRAHREAAAITQRELAQLAGISLAAVRDLEQQRTLYPQPASVRQLCATLGLVGADAEAFRRAAVRPSAASLRPMAPPIARAGPAAVRELVEQARTMRPPAALDTLDNALSVWRSTPACDVAALAGHPRSLALTNERINTVLWHFDLADRLGCHDRSLTALRTLSEEHPLHEPIWGG